MEKFSALSFNIREILLRVEDVRQKVSTMSKEELKKSEFGIGNFLENITVHLDNCLSCLLVINDILIEVENAVDEYEAAWILKNNKEN